MMFIVVSFALIADKLCVSITSKVPLPHAQRGAEAVHVDVPVLPQLLSKLRREGCMVGRREVAQRVPQSQLEGTGTGTCLL